ncbi:lipopolysaccharide biosynthesis protein [Pseudoalteromonas lipolytica]|uniref:Lipopolysaccharide biosynthesis protein n=1 Tax=Pseudoalteromonas lipolytica TaxID=570156 RepID=A0AAD0S664_9GAMM|nr:oligosaccharide flippase family protein [Pseudoalteromonas donghaensis]AXV66461.1 lipopolysaccharide biosynthesis protein [Pseudoalteromonas donghaensis]
MNPRKIAAFALGPILGSALGLITLPIITWYFSQEDIGRLAMLNVVISFSTLFFSLGLDQAYVREYHQTECKSSLLKVTILPGLLLLLVTLGVLLSLDNIISNWLFELKSQILSISVAVAVLSAFLARFFSLILRMNEQGIAYSMSQLLPKLLLIVIIGSYVLFSVKKNLTNLLFANVLATLFVCLIFGWNTRNEWLSGMRERIDFTYLKSLLNFGVPLIFGGLAFWGLTATDKILLKEFSDFEQLGLYSVSISFAAVATIFQSVFSTIWAPTVYKWASNGDCLDKLHKVSRYVLLAVIVLFCFAGLFSWVITLVLPSSYTSVQWILIPCIGFPLFYTLSEATSVGIGISKRSSMSMIATTIAFLINLLGNWFLIPSIGAAGAAISTCVAFGFFLVIKTELSIYVWRPFPRLALYSYTIILIFGAIVSCIYGKSYQSSLIIFWSLLFFSVFIFFREELSELYNWARSLFAGVIV